VLILLGPKNVTFIKPIVKSGYKMWLEYKREVALAEREMEEMKHEVLAPIEEAEREVEAEMKEEMDTLRKEAKMTSDEMEEMRKDLQSLRQTLTGTRGKAGPANMARAPGPGMKGGNRQALMRGPQDGKPRQAPQKPQPATGRAPMQPAKAKKTVIAAKKGKGRK
jgi:hypothetical protein